MPFQPTDLQKPNPQLIQMVFEHLGELLLNATRDSIDPAMRAAGEDICPSDTEIIPFETRMLMGFFVSLRRMLVECGVHDFSFNDLVRPTHERLVKIFSYIINFVRFRESQTSTIDDNFNKAESTKVRIETLYMDNRDMEQRLEDMKRNRKAMEVAVKDKMKRNDELKARLLELKKGQERIAEQLERAKADKSRAQGQLEEKTERLVRIRQESEKLKPYVLESPGKLQDELADLSNNLVQERQQIDSLERRNRALQTSGDSDLSLPWVLRRRANALRRKCFTIVSADPCYWSLLGSWLASGALYLRQLTGTLSIVNSSIILLPKGTLFNCVP